MKYLILEVVNSTQPLYLNIEQIAYFAGRQGHTAVTLKDGREFITTVPVGVLHERLEQLLMKDDRQEDLLWKPLVGIRNALDNLPSSIAQELFVQRRINRGWLPSLLRRWGLL